MDDIYDNLENYDDMSKIDELKNENKELKYKIEEYSSVINKLQKDFDYLAAEHKKLEQNYSSLLKTAKAEIERKTHMINELNMQKDKLVINARQNQCKSSFNKSKRETHRLISDKKSDSSCSVGKPEQVELIKNIPQKDSKIDVQLPSSNLLPTHNDVVSEDRNHLRNRNINSEDRSCTSKENDTQLLNKLYNRHTDNAVKKITNRRKSMPVLSHELKFSSDEEGKKSDVREENKLSYKSRGETLKHVTERNPYNNKVSEMSRTENKFSYYQDFLPGNYNRNKSNMYYNNDKYRSRDQHLFSQRSRRNYSPDTYQRGDIEYKDDYYQRYDYTIQRAYGSPTRETSYHHSRSRDRRSNYNRDSSRDFFRSRNEKERYAEKHKHQINIEEPSCKRQKIDYGYRQIYEDRWHKENDFSKTPLSTQLEDTEHFSCQSPDFVHSDYFTYTPIREIRTTAIMHLEDPRLTSRKYKIINDHGKEVLSTVIGRNVDIIPVKKKVWGFKPVPMPKALLEPPPDDVIKFNRNYMETDKQTLNTSGESGEILDYSSYNRSLQNCEASDKSKNNGTDECLIESNFKEVETTEESNQDNIHGTTLYSQTSSENNINNICDRSLSIGYKIPKLQNSGEVSTNNTKTKDNIPDNSSKNFLDSKSMPQFTNYSKYSDIGYKYDDIATSTKIVEADLVLSDDPSDVIEPEQQTCKKQTKAKCKKNKIEEYSEKNSSKPDHKKYANSTKVHRENAKVVKDNERESSIDKGKGKTMEKSTRHVKRSRKKTEESYTADNNPPKVTKIKKTKKEGNKTQEIKAKFGDLFGDSTSLITPDDLGIVTQEPKAEEKFVTIFENTQNAVDLNLKEMEKVLTKIDNSSIESVEDQGHSPKAHTNCATIKETNGDDCELKNKSPIKEISKSNEIRIDSNTYENLIEETVDTVKTIIISTGKQPQFDLRNEPEHMHLEDIVSIDKVVKPFEVMKALATSTPAKPVHHEHTDSQAVDCSNNDSTNSRTDDLSQKDHEKNSDVPDVRIFVKRRRKAKRVTS